MIVRGIEWKAMDITAKIEMDKRKKIDTTEKGKDIFSRDWF